VYRTDQIVEWIYQHHAASFSEMTSLPAGLRQQLADCARVRESEVAAESLAPDGTRKLLLRWPDQTTTECVLIPSQRRLTACISTQVGCPVRCAFCASGLDGLQRNLTAGQIVEQALCLSSICGPGQRLSHVVFMGLGEPLANYAATLAALRCLNASWGLGISARRITVSTVGLPSQMRRLADEQLQITLALSLHAPDDELRRQLIPWARRVPIGELVQACRYYFDRTGREVTLEYILLDGVNNRPDHAQRLAELCGDMRSNVNLIPYNPVEGLPFRRPSDQSVVSFCSRLRSQGINTHIRRSRGLEADAACGQLRRRLAV
jgi:23S rRNA (adenine2503-C2)-methyltransferase